MSEIATTILLVETIADLRTTEVADGQVVFVCGQTAPDDGRGALYRWNPAVSSPEDTFLNIVSSNVSATGRWIRSVQRNRNLASGALLIFNGGTKTLIVDGAVDNAGLATVSLADDDGAAIFSSIRSAIGVARPTSMATANDIVIGSEKSRTANLKSITFQFARGGSTPLNSAGLLLTNLLSLIVPGLRTPISGTPITIIVQGM